jgi:cytoskeletal protein CcmA (bactofilin family)
MFERKDSAFRKPEHESHGAAAASSATSGAKKSVYIGQSILIKGELTGNEDMTIEGKVEGNINLKDHNLTIGTKGRIEAELFAKNITIMGEVNGNVYAEDKVEVANSGKLNGNISAPRVVIEDGARFKGSVEMDGSSKRAASEKSKTEKNGRGDKKAEAPLSMGPANEKVGTR